MSQHPHRADNAVVTANNILASEMVRACFVSELVGAILFVLPVRALYRNIMDAMGA